MAQKSKITSRPMTKALGTASILSMAIAGANVANALQTDFGADFRADAFYLDGDAYGNDGSGNGAASLLRLKADLKDENTGVSLHTSIQLSGDTWSGDSRNMTTTGVDGSGDPASIGRGGSYNNQANETVTLDTGYVQIPVAGSLIRVGRQASNWNHCFLTCDDRRDRISAIIPTEIGTFVALYDTRSDSFASDNFEDADSGDQIVAAYITRLGGFDVGLLWAHYFKNSGNDVPYAFQNTHIFSPYVKGSLTDGLNLTVGANWFGQNEESGGDIFFGDGQIAGYDYGDATSAFLRLDGDVGAMNWGVQYVAALDGGFMSNGFDTYFSTVNNNPDSTGNPTSLISLGRSYGYQDYDQHLLAGKLGFDITPRLNITGAVGYLNIDDGQDDVDDSSMIYDLSATYKVNDAVTTVASIGVVGANEAFTTAKFGGALPHPGSAGNQHGVGSPSDFDDEDLMAANVGLRVKF